MLPYHFSISQQEPNPTPGFPTMAPPAAVHPDQQQQQHYDHHHFFHGHGQYFNNSETLEAVLRPPRAATSASEREAVGGVTVAASRNGGMVVAAGAGGAQGHGRARKRPFRTDRHSKIRTAQGVRDRRMRLSLDVARDFFALQDRLGFDKASKTVDWLLTQSKPAIDRLAAEPSANHRGSASAMSSPSEAAVKDTAAGKGGGSGGDVSKAASRSSAALMLDHGGCELDRLVAAAPVLREYYYEFGEMMGANGGEGDDDGEYDEDGDFLDGMQY